MYGVMKLMVSKGDRGDWWTHTQRRDGKEKEKEGGETETVFAEYFHWVAYTFVNILFFSQSDSAVTQFLSQQ